MRTLLWTSEVGAAEKTQEGKYGDDFIEGGGGPWTGSFLTVRPQQGTAQGTRSRGHQATRPFLRCGIGCRVLSLLGGVLSLQDHEETDVHLYLSVVPDNTSAAGLTRLHSPPCGSALWGGCILPC